jgi:hypothetical protein
MREVLGYLIQAEGFQEAINLILEISRAEQDVIDRTEKEKKERLQKLLDEQKKNGQPAPAPVPEEKPENKPAPPSDKEQEK